MKKSEAQPKNHLAKCLGMCIIPAPEIWQSWLNAHDSKSCIQETVSRVRIPLSPPGICPARVRGKFMADIELEKWMPRFLYNPLFFNDLYLDNLFFSDILWLIFILRSKKMNTDNKVHVATGVWYSLSFGHTRYHHFPCHIQYERYRIGGHNYISALEGCKPISHDEWGADYDILNGAKPRSTRELIDLTKQVCNAFLNRAEYFAENEAQSISLPMISISMERLVTGATCYQGYKDHMNVKQNDTKETYSFIYSKANRIVTPSNISDVLKKKIEHIHVITCDGISWDQQSKIDPNALLYVYNYDKYDNKGGVYVKILPPDTEVVNEKLCLINPETTGHIPSRMAELFRQKTAPIAVRNPQSKNR